MLSIIHSDHQFLIGRELPLHGRLSEHQKEIRLLWKTTRFPSQHTSHWKKYGLLYRRGSQLYYACAIPAASHYPDHLRMLCWPRGDYVRFTHQGSLHSLPHTIRSALDALHTHQMIYNDTQICYVEVYDENYSFDEAHTQLSFYLPVQTKIEHTPLHARSILSGYASDNHWFGLHFNMNLYRGCPHACIYCDSRSPCYHVQDFEIVHPKANALALLASEMKRRTRRGTIGIGAMSDTYNPLESKLQLTRGALQLALQHGYGIGIATKSKLILRDLDLFQRIARQASCIVKVTITCADEQLARIIEPNAASVSERFEILSQMHAHGVYAGILLMPILPFITDTKANITAIVTQAHRHHAKFIFAFPEFGVTLRDSQRDYYYYMLDEYFPGKRALYEKYYHNQYHCASLRSKALYQHFTQLCEQYQIAYRMEDIISQYQKPGDEQLSLPI